MMENTQLNELIDDYLAGRMSENQQAVFENQIQTDPILRQEVEFQREIVQGIRQHRISMLKGRLQQIEVPQGGWQASLSTGQLVGYGLLGSAVLAGVFYLFSQSEIQTAGPAGPVSPNVNQQVIVEPISSAQAFKEVDSTPTAAQAPTPSPQAEAISARPQAAPSVAKPEPVSSPEEGDNKDIEPGFDKKADLSDAEKGRLKPAGRSVQKTEVVVKKSGRYTYHYQYAGGKLFLFGDFSTSIYELLEFNKQGARELFLYHKGQYFAITPSGEEVLALKPIESKEAIASLELMRLSKTE